MCILIVLILVGQSMYAQPDNLKNGLFLKQLYVNSAYMKQKDL